MDPASAEAVVAHVDGTAAGASRLGHRTLTVVVFRDYATLQRENLVLSAEPLWMCGPFEWTPAALAVDVVATADTAAVPFPHRDRLYRLRDPVGFELLTSSLAVGENVKLW